MRPPLPTNIAIERAGTSSPAPPGWSSGDSGGIVSTGAGPGEVTVARGASVWVRASVPVRAAVSVAGSSSPPHPAIASTAATAQAVVRLK
jgi:hypothetical protein